MTLTDGSTRAAPFLAGSDGETAPMPAWGAPLHAVQYWDCVADGTGLTAVGRVRVDPDEVNLRGHFPGNPIYPGIFIVETLHQLVALALPDAGGAPPVLRELRAARFLAPVLGGDELTLTAQLTPAPEDGWLVQASGVRSDGTQVCTLTAVMEADGARDAADEPATQPESLPEPGPGALDHAAIRALLPQRHPLLLVDRVVELVPGESVHTVKAVTAADRCFAHIPDDAPPDAYTYPASLLIEAFGQSAALLWLAGAGPMVDDDVLLFAAARGVRFHGTVRPGDLVHLRLRLDASIADTAFASGEMTVRGRRIADFRTLTAARRHSSALTNS
jgi:3-hydroxymyristoyl/3-hydroxydecanoyl-(acyl carrier protein) dehydratase